MKKLLTVLLLILTISFTLNINVKAEVQNVILPVEYYDNYKYDLLTGSRSYTEGWASTNRILVNYNTSNIIQIDTNTFHHVLFWDNYNTYLGYSNSTTYSNYNIATNLNVVITNQFTLPVGTKYIAFLNYTGNVGIDDLNGLTLNEVFKDNNLIDFDIANFQPNGGSQSITNGIYTMLINGVSDPSYITYKTGFLSVLNDKYYVKYKVMKGVSTSGFISGAYDGEILGTNQSIGTQVNAPTVNTWYDFSQVITIPNDFTVQDVIKVYSVGSNDNLDTLNIKDMYLIDINDLGITQTVLQMNAYYNDYIEINNTWFNVLSISALETIQPNYDRDFTPYVAKTITEKIDSYLDSINSNNPFAKVLLSIAVILIVVIVLAFMHVSPVIFLMIGAGLYLLFTIIGWLPVWVLIMIALLVLAIIFIKIKGGGNTNV